MPTVHLARYTLLVPRTPRRVPSTGLTSEKALADMQPTACVVPQGGRESMVFGPLIAMPGRSIDRTTDPDRPTSGSCGRRPVHAVVGLLFSGSRCHMARLHQLQRQSREVLVFGRLESGPVDRPVSRAVEPVTASQRPDSGSPSNPGVGPVGSDGRPAGRAPRIMVVDDEPGIHLMARTILEADGCEVIGATDGEAALQALRDTPVDLI